MNLVTTKTVDASGGLFGVGGVVKTDGPETIWFQLTLVVFGEFFRPLCEVHTFITEIFVSVRGAADEFIEIFPGPHLGHR
jgi:hypothetical protein